jgi:hypothetical protein
MFVLCPKAEIREIIDRLVLIALAAQENEFKDQMIHIPLR